MLLHGGPGAFPVYLRCLWLLVLRVLTRCSCVGLLWEGELNEKHHPPPPEDHLGARCALFLCSSHFAWLQPRYDAG
jgi:hypothetical protein